MRPPAHETMTATEFARRAEGLPWVKWRADWQACDCYGLLVLYWRHVHGVELGDVPHTDIGAGFVQLGPRWVECGPESGACAFMAFVGGAPVHCGVLLPGGMLLHADGTDNPPRGGVRVTRLQAMVRVYPDIRFYRYQPEHQP
jgi:cell wall-associated NlpC family hydrolase